jgi:preprotein translocase subunit SecY
MSPFLGGQFADSKLKLSRRFLYTLLLLLLFRILAAIPILNVDEERIHHLLAQNPLIGTVDLFAGGEVISHFSLVAAGIFPYLLALMLVQVVSLVPSRLREMQREGEKGKKRLELITKVLTIPIAFLFAWILSHYLSQQVGLFPGQIRWFTAASFWPSLRIVCLVTLGSLSSTGVSDLITRKGIGSGTEVVLVGGAGLVFVKQVTGAVREAPSKVVALQRFGWIILGSMVVVVLSIYVMSAMRKIPVQYAKRVVGRRSAPSSQSHLPLLLNSGRVFPVSAAIGVLTLLQLSQSFFQAHARSWIGTPGRLLTDWVTPASGWYWIALAALIVFFTYIYNVSLLWQRDEPISESLKKAGAFIPGLRPGQQTEQYLSRVVTDISLPGGLGLALLAAGLPYAILRLTQQNLIVTILSLIVVVTSVQGLRDQVCAYHYAESYEGFLHPTRKKRLWDRFCGLNT